LFCELVFVADSDFGRDGLHRERLEWLAAEEGLKRFDLPDTVVGRRRMVERRRAVEEEVKKCGMPVVPEDVDARCSH
jgi:hypothetical protein